jgi:hypothetical protein
MVPGLRTQCLHFAPIPQPLSRLAKPDSNGYQDGKNFGLNTKQA